MFEEKNVRRLWDESAGKWRFSVVDVCAVLTNSDYQTARNYWKWLKGKLNAEGSQLVSDTNQLKMEAPDGKMRQTDVADAEQLLRLIQSIPSPKAEPFKRWLAKVGYERMQEIEDPELMMLKALVRTKPPLNAVAKSPVTLEKTLKSKPGGPYLQRITIKP